MFKSQIRAVQQESQLCIMYIFSKQQVDKRPAVPSEDF